MKKKITLLAGVLFFICRVQAQDDSGLLVTHIKDRKAKLNEQYQRELRETAPWQAFKAKHAAWDVVYNESNAKPHRAYGKPFSVNVGNTIDEKASYFIKTELAAFGIPSNDLVLTSSFASKKYHFVNYSQKYQGLEVLHSRANVKMTLDGQVIMFGLDVYDNITISTTPALSEADAIAKAEARISNLTTSTAAKSLKILPVPSFQQCEFKLVYEIMVEAYNSSTKVPAKYYTLVDANTGEILYRDNLVRNADVETKATVYKTNPYAPSSQAGLANLKLKIDGTDYFADGTGKFTNLPVTSPTSIIVGLEGKWSKVVTGGNNTAMPTFAYTINPGSNTLDFDSKTTIRHLSAYYHVNIVHDFHRSFMPTFTALDKALLTRVDRIDGNCNAFYDGTSINFYTTSNNCYALSMVGDVIYHEYGHGINDEFYRSKGTNFNNGSMNEGYADVWGLSITKDPKLGVGISDTSSTQVVRRYDINKKVYPKNIVGEVHADGEIIAGAWWDTGLNFGSTEQMTALFVEALNGLANGPTGTEGQVYTDVLIDALQADDTDGDLTNGTPNDKKIIDAFALHGITLLSNVNLAHAHILSAPSNTPTKVKATLTNIVFPWAFKSINGLYKVNTNSNWDSLTFTNTSGNDYEATIPSQPKGSLIAYYLLLKDKFGGTTNVTPGGANDVNDPNLPYYTLVGYTVNKIEDFDDNQFVSWTYNAADDNATTGIWESGELIPSYITAGDPKSIVQPKDQHTTNGSGCAFTGNADNAQSTAGMNDIDNGKTTLLSPRYDLTKFVNPAIDYYRWYTNAQGATPNSDYWRVFITNDGTNWVKVEETMVTDRSWRRKAIRIKDYIALGAKVQLKFVAEDAGAGSLVEAAVDDYILYEEEGANSSISEREIAELNIYPNPASTAVMVQISALSAMKAKLVIVNNIGQVVKNIEGLNIAPGTQRHEINTTDLPSGMYTLTLSTNDGSVQEKISILR